MTASGRPFRPGVGLVAGVNEILGDVAQLAVQVLRRPAQHVESLGGRDSLALHQDALRLADHLSRGECRLQVLGPASAFLVFV